MLSPLNFSQGTPVRLPQVHCFSKRGSRRQRQASGRDALPIIRDSGHSSQRKRLLVKFNGSTLTASPPIRQRQGLNLAALFSSHGDEICRNAGSAASPARRNKASGVRFSALRIHTFIRLPRPQHTPQGKPLRASHQQKTPPTHPEKTQFSEARSSPSCLSKVMEAIYGASVHKYLIASQLPVDVETRLLPNWNRRTLVSAL